MTHLKLNEYRMRMDVHMHTLVAKTETAEEGPIRSDSTTLDPGLIRSDSTALNPPLYWKLENI